MGETPTRYCIKTVNYQPLTVNRSIVNEKRHQLIQNKPNCKCDRKH
ncbi:MAG: hypothetical protein F6K65_06055 [Moorea sp. SIO3C2]|nr:hypothetical protein [Moorena sp. SIO3C2]